MLSKERELKTSIVSVGRLLIVMLAAVAGNQTHDTLGDVGVKVVANDAPFLVRRAAAEDGVEEGDEVLFGAPFADNALELASGDVKGGNEGLRVSGSLNHELLPCDAP